jgi:hypothetical protein
MSDAVSVTNAQTGRFLGQADRLVEAFDAFAARFLRFITIRLGMLEKHHLCLAPGCGTTVALSIVS